ncbi:MAG: hypothetical protein HWE18_04015 [Gammaproteobacteria bacterium]|nr:hypothetical protein [Gammaproteobacteria bacterium]
MQFKLLLSSLALLLLYGCGSGSSNHNKAADTNTLDTAAETAYFTSSEPSEGPSRPQIAYFDNGNAVAIWLQHSDQELWTNHYSKNTGWGTAGMLQTNSNVMLGLYQLASNGTSAIATWGEGSTLRASHYDAEAQQWNEPKTIVTEASGNVDPRIAMNIDGKAVVAWTIGNDIKASYSSALNTWSAAFPLDNSDTGVYPHDVAVDASGHAIAVWSQDSKVFSRRYVSGTWGDITTIDDSADTSNIVLKLDDAGNAIATWMTIQSDPKTLSYAQYSADADWNTPVLLEDGNLVNQPLLAMNADGKAIIVWTTLNTETDVLTYTSRFYSPDTGLGEEETFEVNTNYHYNNSIEIDSSGNALLVWMYDFDDTNEEEDKAFLLFNQYQAGKGWGTKTELTSIGNAYGDYDPKLSFNASGEGMMIFGGVSDDGYGIYSRLYQ